MNCSKCIYKETGYFHSSYCERLKVRKQGCPFFIQANQKEKGFNESLSPELIGKEIRNEIKNLTEHYKEIADLYNRQQGERKATVNFLLQEIDIDKKAFEKRTTEHYRIIGNLNNLINAL